MGFGKLFLGSWGGHFGSICTNPSVFLSSQCKPEAWTGADVEVTGLFLTFSHNVKALNLILNTHLFLQMMKKTHLTSKLLIRASVDLALLSSYSFDAIYLNVQYTNIFSAYPGRSSTKDKNNQLVVLVQAGRI